MSEAYTNGVKYRLEELQRRIGDLERVIREAKVDVISTEVGYCRNEIKDARANFDGRLDDLDKRMDDDIRGIRRLLYGTFASVIGGAIFVAVSAGLHA